MGLISEYRKYKKQKEMVAFLEEEYGITKDDLKYLKHLIELMMMKFPFSDFDYFDYKYFRIRPKKDYEEK